MPKRNIAIAGGVVGTLVIALVGGLLLFGGSDDGVTASITEAPSTTVAAATAATTAASEETSTSAPVVEEVTTTSGETFDLAVTFTESAGKLERTVQDFYAWIGDPELDPPPMTTEVETYAAAAAPAADASLEAQHATATPYEERVAVVTAGEDVVLLVDYPDSGWTVVGAKLTSLGLEPFYGDPIRHVMIIGTDARAGQDQKVFRGDSLHILTSSIADGAGSILGFPRDSHVDAPYGGMDKFTHINALAGPEAVVDVARDLTGLPVEGYIVTGFLGFEQLVNEFGGVTVNVPFAMADPKSKAYLNAGTQVLWGANALAFSRNRSIYGSDFTRSFHHGLVIDGALDTVQARGILALPDLLRILSNFTWTNLSTADLLTLGACAYEIDAESMINVVLPGQIRTIGGASVVVLDPEAEDYYRDLDDGVLTEPAE